MIRVLVVDDSAIVRKVLERELSKADDIEVVGTAADPYEARERIREREPDVLTLDLEMPRMNGLSFLKILMEHHPIPVVVVSSVAPRDSRNALRALELGAVEVVPKPGSASSVPEIRGHLLQAVRAAGRARPERLRASAERGRRRARRDAPGGGVRAGDALIAIGASTGGTRATEYLLRRLPEEIPPILIVQHLSAEFTGPYARRLDRVCPFAVEQARDGRELEPGLAVLAPGDRHLMLRRVGERRRVELHAGPPVNRHRPSVDVLFHSVAQEGEKVVAMLLTGMGRDGARGLQAIRESGGRTLAQDEESSVVYGMPRAAAEIGAAQEIVSLERMPERILDHLGAREGASTGGGRPRPTRTRQGQGGTR